MADVIDRFNLARNIHMARYGTEPRAFEISPAVWRDLEQMREDQLDYLYEQPDPTEEPKVMGTPIRVKHGITGINPIRAHG